MNTRDPHTSPADRTSPPSATDLIKTVGLDPSLKNLLAWARNLGVDEPLMLLLDASRSFAEPQFTGTVLTFLRQKTPADCLRQWELELSFLPGIRALAQACAVSPYIYEHHRAMPAAHSVAQQLRDGQLAKLPLIALIARPVHAQDRSTEDWIATLRVWCFVQLLDAVHGLAAPNPYLITVVNKLRQAIDRDAQWLDLFARLRGPTESFHALTRHLSSAASALLADSAAPVTRPAHQSMLAELRNFCQGKSRAASSSETADYGVFRRYLQHREVSAPPTDWAPYAGARTETQENSEARTLGTLAFDASDDEPTTLIVAAVDETDTPPEQERKARGVLLSSVEDCQLLPFSWNRPNPEERQVLEHWLAQAAQGLDEDSQALAAMVYLAVQTANSLRTVLRLEISAETAIDWRVDIAGGYLHRQPPRRHNGWRASGETAAWVNPRAKQVRVNFPVALRAALIRLLADSPQATVLENLWTARGTLPESLFRDLCQHKPGLQRVSSGMLAQWLEQSAFERSADPVLSQLVASHSRSGLPGACAYASFTQDRVTAALDLPISPPADGIGRIDPPEPDLNAAGSELSPLEALLRQACADARAQVNHLAQDPDQWVAHHNCLTAYVTLALLAATGARPVSSPFESLRHLDLVAGQVYVEDKVSSRMHQGRLLPLPALVASLIQQHYLPHLARLARILARIDTSMSAEIDRLANGQPSGALPVLFFLSAEPELGWIEVSEKSLSALDLFRWPLPWNLMRHRVPTELKRMDLDHEIINGLTGHGEQGTAAYGPYSVRVWQDDAQVARPHLDALLARLDLQAPECALWPVERAAAVQRPVGGTALAPSQPFGAHARRSQRNQAHAAVADQARREIEQFVAGRPLDSLSPDEWERLSQAMLLTPSGMPQAMGSLRYDTLCRWITNAWADNAGRPRLKKRYLPALEEASPFTADSIGATARVEQARACLRVLFATLAPSRVSQRDGLVLGAVSLLLQSRVTDLAVLQDVLTSRNIHLLRFAGTVYLQHAKGQDRDPTAPGRRFRLDPMAAALLAKGSFRLDVCARPLPQSLHSVAAAAGIDVGPTTTALQWIKRLAPLVEQSNVQQFPGLVAAYLGGRVVTAALRPADWLRVSLGYAVQLPAFERTANDKAQTDGTDEATDILELSDPQLDDYVFLASELTAEASPQLESMARAPRLDAEQRARDFFQALRDRLNQHARQKSSPRRDLDAALRRVIREHTQASRSCRLLGEWLRSLLWRRTRHGPLSLRSLSRYLNALSVCFEAVATAHDLLACDDEAVTDFYLRVMAARRSIRPSAQDNTPDAQAQQGTATQDEPTSVEEDDRYKTWQLALVLLRDFHRLVSRELAVEDPDWSEIDATEDALSISPGLLLEQDYLHALALAAPDPEHASREELARAFILLVSMRFGLRGAEVTGLKRDDWVETAGGSVIVLVRKNAARDLKTPAARRQVPLLFTLTPLELRIVDRFLALWEGLAQGDRKVSLFANANLIDKLMNDKLLRWQASQLVKQATLNANLSLHHARHTFANGVALMLLDNTQGLWPHVTSAPVSPEQRAHVRKLLLCTEEVTRRALWALARLLGHAHPVTTVRSYLHFLPEWADRYIGWPSQEYAEVRRLSDVGLSLDDLPRAAGYLQAPQTGQTPPLRADAQAALRFLQLYQTRMEPARAAFSATVSDDEAALLISLIDTIDKTLAKRSHINVPLGGRTNLLGHIRDDRWREWITRAADVSMDAFTAAGLLPNQRKDLLQMIGPSRQVLLFQREHFRLFRAIVDAWQLDDASYAIHAPKKMHSRLTEWAAECDLTIKPHAPDVTPQLDTIEVGDPPVIIQYRCAVLPITGEAARLRSSHELVLLVVLAIFLS